MQDYQERIQLDRYAKKDPDAQPLPGDLVVASLQRRFEHDGDVVESREIGVITKVGTVENGVESDYTVALRNKSIPKEQWEVASNLRRSQIEVLVEKTYADICRRVAAGVAKNEKPEAAAAFQDSVYNAMVNELFVPGGRILAGVGLENRTLTLFNCYVFPPPHDSRGGILDTMRLLFDTYSVGGGAGLHASSLRPKGAVVRKVNGRSSGAVSWMDLYSFLTGKVEQGGSRRGAGLLGLWVWHPDVIEFVEAKSKKIEFTLEDGRVVSRNSDMLENTNVSVLISDKFMEAVKSDAMWELVFPDTNDPTYNDTWKGDLEDWLAAGKKVQVYQKVRAKWLWDLIIKKAWESGEPGILFMDRSNKMSNSYYYNKLSCTNPCIAGWNRISTNEGLIKLKPLVEQTPRGLKVIVDSRLNPNSESYQVRNFSYSGMKPVYRLLTKEGYAVDCTADHQIMTNRGWVKAAEITEDDCIHITHGSGAFGPHGSKELGFVLGWLVGDGFISGEAAGLCFYDEKMELADRYAEIVQSLVVDTAHRDYSTTPTFSEEKNAKIFASERLYRVLREYGVTSKTAHFIPEIIFGGTRETQCAFLSALFTADGTVNDGGDKGCSVRLDSVSYEMLQDVQLLLLNFGIYSRIYRDRKPAGLRMLPDGKGGLKEYQCQAWHSLAISKQSMKTFADEIGFLLPYKQAAVESYLNRCTRGPYSDKFVATLDNLTYVGEHETFDLTEPVTHSFSANGFVVHNCGEIVLEPYGICNLGHVNLAKFIRPDVEQFPDQEIDSESAIKKMDFDKFKEVIALAIQFLDNITDINVYHIPETETQQKGERRLGLGVFGYAELLVRLGLRYGSPEAEKFTHYLFRKLSKYSYLSSVELAKERGSFPAFDRDKFLASGFMKIHDEDVIEAVKQHGIRNVTVNTCAPTGSVATMLNTTTGIEPYFLAEWTARSRIGVAEEKAGVLAELKHKFGKNLPPYFVTTDTVTPEEHVRIQAAAQRWIDSSIAKTVNLPNSATVEDVSNVYNKLYELGCKGGTIYRDRSRDKQVLYHKGVDKKIPVEITDSYMHPNGGLLRPRIKAGLSVTLSQETPTGWIHGTLRMHPTTGEPYDVFLSSGKGEIAADVQALGRLISVLLRWPDRATINQATRLELIRDQLYRIPGGQQVGFGLNATISMPDGVAHLLHQYLAGDFPLASMPLGIQPMEQFIQDQEADSIAVDVLRRLISPPSNQEGKREGMADADAATDDTEEPFDYLSVASGQKKGYSSTPLEMCPECKQLGLLRQIGHCPHCVICGCKMC